MILIELSVCTDDLCRVNAYVFCLLCLLLLLTVLNFLCLNFSGNFRVSG